MSDHETEAGYDSEDERRKRITGHCVVPRVFAEVEKPNGGKD